MAKDKRQGRQWNDQDGEKKEEKKPPAPTPYEIVVDQVGNDFLISVIDQNSQPIATRINIIVTDVKICKLDIPVEGATWSYDSCGKKQEIIFKYGEIFTKITIPEKEEEKIKKPEPTENCLQTKSWFENFLDAFSGKE